MLLDIYRECLFNRYFEYRIAEDIKNNKITCPTYLSVGSEYIPVLLKYAIQKLKIKKVNIFSQHRCHSYHNTFIQKPLELALEIYGSKKGCNGGHGGSASIASENNKYKLIGHSGLLGDNCPLGIGYAFSSNELCIIVLGDGAVEEDYVLGSLGFAASKKCPILFIIEDNDLSILTKKNERRNWEISKVAKSFGIDSYNLYNQNEIETLSYYFELGIQQAKSHKPTLLNINYNRHYWHVGGGQDRVPEYDYLENFEKELLKTHSIKTLATIKQKEKSKILDIWKQLEIQLKN